MYKTVRLGIDVGKSRIGVARTDIDGTLAVPVETVSRDAKAAARISDIASEYDCGILYVGLPLSLKGSHTASTQDALDFAREIAEVVDIPVRLIDERLSTVSATQSLQAAGKNAKSAKAIIDQAAAVVILEQALSIERSTKQWAGRSLDE